MTTFYQLHTGYELEACSGAGDTGSPRGIRGDGYEAHGVSTVSGTELDRATAGSRHAAKSCCVTITVGSMSDTMLCDAVCVCNVLPRVMWPTYAWRHKIRRGGVV